MSIAEHESAVAGSRVTSKDGTALAVTAVGRGTPVILMGGAFNDRSTVAALAAALAPGHTAVSYDRRGRSASEDRSTGFEVQNEIDDLAAVIAHVGGRAALFGHSSGAILALEAASRGLPVDRIAVYEPPLRVEDTPPYPSADAYDELTDLVAAGDRDAAAACFLRRILFVPEEAVAMMRADPSWPFLVGHALTLPYDVLLSRPWEVADRRPLAALDLPVLAMYGDRTSAALEAGTRAVAEAVPGAQLLAIPGQDHGVLQHPETLEPALAKFFAAG